MDVVIAGGHGKIALLAERLLVDAGHRVRALVRNPEHVADVQAAGAMPLVADLEALDAAAIADQIGGSDAIVYAAGAGPGSGPERKWTMDLGGAVKMIEVAQRNGIDRYIMISAANADPEAEDDGGFGTYLRAKGQADAALAESGLQYTTLKPVRLTDEPPTGHVSTSAQDGSPEIPRADVASAVLAALEHPETAGSEIVLRSGETPIAHALTA